MDSGTFSGAGSRKRSGGNGVGAGVVPEESLPAGDSSSSFPGARLP